MNKQPGEVASARDRRSLVPPPIRIGKVTKRAVWITNATLEDAGERNLPTVAPTFSLATMGDD